MNKKYFRWFIKWYKDYLFDMSIMIMIPNELSNKELLAHSEGNNEDVFIIELFERMPGKEVDCNKLLKEMCEKADECGIKLYVSTTVHKVPNPDGLFAANGFEEFTKLYMFRNPK
jgi:hypothetical protein